MNILALDLATKTGWAHSCGASGVWNLSILRDESSGMRWIRFESKIHELCQATPTDVIACEEVSVNSGEKSNSDAFKLAAKLQGIVERLSEIYDYECCSRNLQQIKAHAIPKRPGVKVSRNKDAMVAAARKRWPDIEILDDNHADALWLLDLVQHELVGAKGD